MKFYGDVEVSGEIQNVTFNSKFMKGDRVKSTDGDGENIQAAYGEITGAELRGGVVHYTVAWDDGYVTTVPASYITKA